MPAPKKPLANKSVPIFISLYPRQIAMVEELMAALGTGSKSDVIRQAVLQFHKSYFPRYGGKPARGVEDELVDPETGINSDIIYGLSDEDFVKELDGVIAKSLPNSKYEGKDVAMFNGWYGGITIMPLTEVKEWFKNNKEDVAQHKSVRASGDASTLIEDNFATPLGRTSYLKDAGLVVPPIEEAVAMANKAREKRGLPPVPDTWMKKGQASKV